MCEAQSVDQSPPRKRALVTGASSGIGEAFAVHYARLGYDVVLAARNTAELARVATVCRGHGAHVGVVTVDLSTPAGVERLGTDCGAVDVLVANAGVTHAAPVGATDRDRLDSVTYLMATGVVRLCEIVVPTMVSRGSGAVIIVSSIAAFTPMRKAGPYAAAKSFSAAYARSLALEVAGKGVGVVAVCPGYVRTNLHERAGLGHLARTVPNWLWIPVTDVVRAAERALVRGRSVVIPGRVYRLAAPFLASASAQRIWRRITRRT